MMNIYERGLSAYGEAIKEKALLAFREDLGEGDVTTEAVFAGEDPRAEAVITAEEDCTLAGILEARAIFEDGGLKLSGKRDGDTVKKGEEILKIKGSLKEILARERVCLNYVTRMSGIATLSRKLAEKHDKRVLFLRKTDPGLLFSEKRAVAVGGCPPHRMNLDDGILIKDNHIDELAKGSNRLDAIRKAINKASESKIRIEDAKALHLQGESKKFLLQKSKSKKIRIPIEIEVDTVEEAQYAAEEFTGLKGPNIILLDNMSLRDVKRASDLIRRTNAEIIIEASGGIKEDTIQDYLNAGADYVSTSLFVGAKPCGFKLEIRP
jgi:nicotinate-nucleotide pyrophosphorylase (carboxylating)